MSETPQFDINALWDSKTQATLNERFCDSPATQSAIAATKAAKAASIGPITIGSLRKRSTSVNGYGLDRPASYFTDYAGPGTSQHVADQIGFMLGELGDKSFDEMEFRDGYRGDSFNATLGTFERDGKILITLAELKKKFYALVAKYEIDEETIERWCETGKPWEERRAWESLPFEERIQSFRKAESR